MNKFKKMLAGITGMAVLAASGVFAGVTVSSEQVLLGYRGDLDWNSTLNNDDYEILVSYLLGKTTLGEEFALNADLTGDNRVDAFDAALLRRCLKGDCEWKGIYGEVPTEPPTEETTEPTTEVPTEPPTEVTTQPQTEPPETTAVTTTTVPVTTVTTTQEEPDNFIDAPIAKVNSSLFSQGDSNLVIFCIEFPDCQYSNELSASEVEQIAFGAADESSANYPFESMSAFYSRSSKGAMNLSGKVFTYTAKNSISAYNEDKVGLAEECFEAFKDSEDFSRFDGNGDGKIDATLFTVPESASDDYWWPCSGGFGDPEYTVDGVTVGNIITGNVAPADKMNFNSSYLHEMGHCMGLPDYYLYYSTDFDSMHGTAGTELMDADAYSDFCSFSKLMLGWYRESQISVFDSSKGAQTFTLKNAQTDAGNCVIIPYGNLDDNYFSEYFIIEYSTIDGNNSGIYNRGWGEIESGIRIHHIKADFQEDYWYPHLKYQNGSEATNNDDAGIRLIRLVNDNGGPFTTGDVINSSTSGFGWYDSGENESIDPGVTISVGALQNGEYTITITP